MQARREIWSDTCATHGHPASTTQSIKECALHLFMLDIHSCACHLCSLVDIKENNFVSTKYLSMSPSEL